MCVAVEVTEIGHHTLGAESKIYLNKPDTITLLTDIDHCHTDPCGSHGSCVDLPDSYHCICDVGYTGYNCNLSICDDSSSACENNSTCSLCEEGVCNSTGLSFQCDCADDFYGVLCTDRKSTENNNYLDL